MRLHLLRREETDGHPGEDVGRVLAATWGAQIFEAGDGAVHCSAWLDAQNLDQDHHE